MAEQEREAGYHVWARRSGEQEATVRFVAQDYEHAENEAIHIARASGDEGAVSVYVADAAGRPLWAAGEKAVELRATGVRLNTWGKVLDEPVDVLMPTDQNELREALEAARDFIVNDVYAYESDENDRQGDVEQIINAALAAASPTAGAERPTDDEIEAAACPEPSEEEVEAAAKASFATLGKTGVDLNEVPKLKALWTDAARAALLAARAVKEDQ